MPSAQRVDENESEDGGGHYLDKTAQTIGHNGHALLSVYLVFIHPDVPPGFTVAEERRVHGDEGHGRLNRRSQKRASGK
jgi:hypothetical protein